MAGVSSLGRVPGMGRVVDQGGCFVLILHVDVLPSEPLGLPVLWCPGFPSADLVQSRGTHFVHAFGVFTVLTCRPRASPPPWMLRGGRRMDMPEVSRLTVLP